MSDTSNSGGDGERPADALVDGRSLLVVTAHPDDEALAFGGMLARCAATGGVPSLLCLTRGELGWAGAPPQPELSDELARTRTEELRHAAEILGIVHLRLLDFPDSRLSELTYPPIVEAIHAAIRDFQPDVVATFGADGLYWHQDHVVVHYTVTHAIQSIQDRATVPELVYGALRAGMMRELLTCVEGPHVPPDDLTIWGLTPDVFGLYAAEPTHVLDVRPYVRQKLAALRSHRTQMGEAGPFVRLSEQDAVRFLGAEYFHMAQGPPLSRSLS